MTIKPRIGVLFTTSGWFRDVRLQNDSLPLTQEVDTLARDIIERLSSFIEPVYHGVLYTVGDARKAAGKIRNADVDGLIISPLMWSEDRIVRAALKELQGLPIVVCTFFPADTLPETLCFHDMLKGSGSVGVLQLSGMLKREGYAYRSVSGCFTDERVYRKITEQCRSMSMIRRLKNVKCGVLPFRCDQMSTTYVDEFVLRRDYGVELEYLELQRFREAAKNVTGQEIKRFRQLLADAGSVIEVDDRNLVEGIRYALAMEKIAEETGINILAMNDVIDEMHACFGLRPCLTNPRLSETGLVVSMEADIAAGIAMYVLRNFTGESPMYTEIFTADLNENAFLMGHAGYHDTVNHDPSHKVRIVSDVEYRNSDPFTGACSYFKFKPGPVTAVNCVYTGEKLRLTVFEGESLPGPSKLEGNCHLFCRSTVPVCDFYDKALELGVSQHWAVVPGHVMRSLDTLCYWLGIEFCTISQT